MSEEKDTTKKAPKKETVKKAKVEDATVVVKKAPAKTAVNYDNSEKKIASGKRKNATAIVVIKPGKGKYIINDKNTLEQYFSNRFSLLNLIKKPFKIANMEGQYDVAANLKGGGKAGQAGALAHGITKALLQIAPEIKKQLKVEGLVTRDSRVKETKKYGRKKARKGFTYRKR